MNYPPILEAAVRLIDYLWLLASKEMTVSVADTEKYLINVSPKELNLGIKPGDPIKPGSIADIVLREGKRQVRRIPKEVFGVPFVGVGVPLKDEENKIIGLILTGTPITDQENVRELAENLAVAAEQITATTQNLAASSQQLAVTTEHLSNQAGIIKNEVEQLDEVVRIVNGITNRTNILGLNAAIEAARAGAQGRGFSVVADEIRKMAADTNNSTRQIATTLHEMQEMLVDISSKINNLNDLFQGQTAGTEEIASSSQQISEMSQNLMELANKLL